MLLPGFEANFHTVVYGDFKVYDSWLGDMQQLEYEA